MEIIHYQTWIKKEFYKRPLHISPDQLLRAKEFYKCDRICFCYRQDGSTKEQILRWIFEEHNYDNIFRYKDYDCIVYRSPNNDARIYVYLGKLTKITDKGIQHEK